MWKQVNSLDSIRACLFIFNFFVNLPFWACEWCNDLTLPGPADLGVRALCLSVLGCGIV